MVHVFSMGNSKKTSRLGEHRVALRHLLGGAQACGRSMQGLPMGTGKITYR